MAKNFTLRLDDKASNCLVELARFYSDSLGIDVSLNDAVRRAIFFSWSFEETRSKGLDPLTLLE